jgi:acetyl-CoA carboxylase carboxyltransferase component
MGTGAGNDAIAAPMQGTVVAIVVALGDLVRRGDELLVLEAMKMQHPIIAAVDGQVTELRVAVGALVQAGEVLARLRPGVVGDVPADRERPAPPVGVRSDLAEVLARREFGADAARPAAVAKRHALGLRTARENLADLCDPESFVEYGPTVVAAQRSRRPIDELQRDTPADGLVAGVATVNAALVGPDRARCVVMAYDYTVLAGTQGHQNHRKTDRMLQLAESDGLPVMFFTEGGGGRPGDTDLRHVVVSGLECPSFRSLARLSGRVPLVGINAGRCFAGNAAFLGCCDVIIATRGSNLGMGGPTMIEGGGLGVWAPEDIGPIDVQTANGVVDVVVDGEAGAVDAAKRYLSYFQGAVGTWGAADQAALRDLVPVDRLRVYDVRRVLETLVDADSLLELRRDFGPGMITALARVEGRPLGIVANNPQHLSGAIESPGADKAARFMQLCDAFGLPILFCCDTPGIMVGPEAERSGTVRHASRMFVIGANLEVPCATIVLRKGYGLGAQAMAAGHFKAPRFLVAWPTGEFGPMGLEGAVRLGFRRELDAIGDPAARAAKFQEMVAASYAHGRAINVASYFEIDDVIDPAESRRWIASAFRGHVPAPGRRRYVDPW